MTDVEMIPTLINERWELLLPEHRAARPEWPHWEKERLASMALNLAPGDVVIDVGAEEGDLPALYASWGCRVALVEPNPMVWPNIRAIWEANELSKPIDWHVGFAGAEGYFADDWQEKHVRPADDWPKCAYGPVIGDHGFLNLCERGREVTTITLDDWATYSPAAITIDVEGAELEVLRGATNLLAYVRPLVWVSVHPLFIRDMYSQSPREFHKFMRNCRYDGHLLESSHEEHWLFLPQ